MDYLRSLWAVLTFFPERNPALSVILGRFSSFIIVAHWLRGAHPAMGKRGRARSRSRSPHAAAGAPGASDANTAGPAPRLFGSGYYASGLVKCLAAHAREQLQELFDCGLLAPGPRWKTEGGDRPHQAPTFN